MTQIEVYNLAEKILDLSNRSHEYGLNLAMAAFYNDEEYRTKVIQDKIYTDTLYAEIVETLHKSIQE